MINFLKENWFRLSIGLLVVNLLGVGCTNLVSAPTHNSEKQIVDITKDNAVIFDLSQKCSNSAQKFFKDQGYTDSTFISHYNRVLNKCFISVSALKQTESGFVVTKELNDAIEGSNYGLFMERVGKNPENIACYTYPKGRGKSINCSGRTEYDIFEDGFMNEDKDDPLHLFD